MTPFVSLSLSHAFLNVQIDNQLLTTFNPVVLHSKTSTPPQFLKLATVRDKTYSNILYLRYFSLLIRECWVCCDEELLLKLLSFSDFLMESLNEGNESEYEDINPMKIADNDAMQDQMIYNSLFLLNPIQVNVTFIPRKGSKKDIRKSEITRLFLRLPEEMLPEIENAPLRLHGLLLQNSYTTRSELLSKLQARYKSQLSRRFFVLIGSLNVLGNPINFVQNLGTGVRDFFYEPAKGIAISPKEFGKRIGRATELMARKTLFAVFDAASKVTENLGKGVAALSMDRPYQRQRTGEVLGHKPQNLIKGLQYGAQSLIRNVKKGIAGLVEKPREGAKREGVKGALKGVAKAIAGVIIKPAVGCFDLVSKTTEGIKNVTKLSFVVNRKRPPRYFGPEHRHITVYSPYEARGQELLYSLRTREEGYVDREQTYLFHEEWPASNRFIIISDKRIYYSNKLNVEWEIKWKDVITIHMRTQWQTPCIVILVQLPKTQLARVIDCIHHNQAEKLYNTLRQLWKRWKLSRGEMERFKCEI
jgi:vacuolar protein sorting-associated protein 13A/C